jgi:hypothetical protein
MFVILDKLRNPQCGCERQDVLDSEGDLIQSVAIRSLPWEGHLREKGWSLGRGQEGRQGPSHLMSVLRNRRGASWSLQGRLEVDVFLGHRKAESHLGPSISPSEHKRVG